MEAAKGGHRAEDAGATDAALLVASGEASGEGRAARGKEAGGRKGAERVAAFGGKVGAGLEFADGAQQRVAFLFQILRHRVAEVGECVGLSGDEEWDGQVDEH